MSEEKSHVGMFNCFFCGEPMGILLERRFDHKGQLRKTLPKNVGAINHEPCAKCQELMNQGIMLISVDEGKTENPENPFRSGCICVVTDGAVGRIFPHWFAQEVTDAILKKRMVFISDAVWDKLGLPRENIDNLSKETPPCPSEQP